MPEVAFDHGGIVSNHPVGCGIAGQENPEPLSLETSKPNLLGDDQRFGFQVTAERTISPEGPRVWFLTHPSAC